MFGMERIPMASSAGHALGSSGPEKVRMQAQLPVESAAAESAAAALIVSPCRPWQVAELLRLAAHLPLYALSVPAALLLLLWRRGRLLRREGRHRGPAVMLGGRQVVFGDSLHLLIQGFPSGAMPPVSSQRLLEVLLQLPRGEDSDTQSAASSCLVTTESFCVLPVSAADRQATVDVASAMANDRESLRGKEAQELVLPLSCSYLTSEGFLRRKLLFAWSVGFQVASAALRGVGLPGLPAMRVAAVVLPYMPQKGALLLTQRAPRGGSYNSMWVFPGGAVDQHEHPSAAAARELKEETGMSLRDGTLQFLCAYQARNEAQCLTYLMLIYRGEVAEEVSTLRLQRKEVAQVAFLTPAAVECLLSSGQTSGRFVEGLAYGAGDELLDRPVALEDLTLAPDAALSTGPGIGGGHWFALREWCRSGGANVQ
ncbi:unnamed protein product [Polarella glacialis]|uniref:Nudix hydrolase domain-containing protein n=1 Tax=Polarella glacialis TaxID=89957 RepID=A0A813JK37_POLGL|nr:unnamed protein product [Polarella glacialis]CAE8678555.1 unnamed protein product [Polarella glacialis]